MRENVTFKMNLVSHLAAADCAFGVPGNIDVSKHTCTIIYHQQDPDNTDVLEVTFPKNGSLFALDISFKMNLVSRLATADCVSDVAGNIDISKRTCTIIYHQQDLDNIDILKSSSQKTARYFSKLLHHIVEHNISFQMNLVSRLAAAVWAPGNHLNFNIAKHSDTVISQNSYKIWI